MNYLNPSATDTLLISLVGFVTVFAVLVVLMCIIKLISVAFGEKKRAPAPADTPPAPARDKYEGVALHGVDDRTAAILMAIVASKLERPLDELRFVSIKEVK